MIIIELYAWRRKLQPPLVFLPGKSHGQRSLAGCSSWGCKVSDMPECAHTYTYTVTHTQMCVHMRALSFSLCIMRRHHSRTLWVLHSELLWRCHPLSMNRMPDFYLKSRYITYMHICNWITLLCTWNIVSQLYINKMHILRQKILELYGSFPIVYV